MLDKLIESASKAYENAYAPYSQFQVGAAILDEQGNIHNGCIAMINGGLGLIGEGINSLFGINIPVLSLNYIFGFILSPVAWIIGVPWSEAMTAGGILGQKVMINEFVLMVN